MPLTPGVWVRSAHEVHIDDEQLSWFEDQLQEAGDRPVVVFSHAPAMGSGLKAVLEVSPESFLLAWGSCGYLVRTACNSMCVRSNVCLKQSCR